MRSPLPIALLAFVTLPAVACEPNGEPWFALEVEAAEYAGPDRTLRVALHDNGCAAVRRPAFHRAPGEYRLTVDIATRQQLALLAGAPALRGFDPAEVRSAFARRLATGDEGKGELFEVHDAATYRLRLRDGVETRRIEFSAVPEHAERFPGVEGLAEFAAAVELAYDIANRDVHGAGSQP